MKKLTYNELWDRLCAALDAVPPQGAPGRRKAMQTVAHYRRMLAARQTAANLEVKIEEERFKAANARRKSEIVGLIAALMTAVSVALAVSMVL